MHDHLCPKFKFLFCWQEVMFMGNGEQYIWKPPEDDDMLMHQNKALGPVGAHTVENMQPSAAVVSKDSSVCAPACLLFGWFVKWLCWSLPFQIFPRKICYEVALIEEQTSVTEQYPVLSLEFCHSYIDLIQFVPLMYSQCIWITELGTCFFLCENNIIEIPVYL